MATLKDVATAAKVSPITVSRVINTPELVKQGTRQRVQKIMAAMQYVPNVAAKNLVSKRSGIIDVFVPESIDLSNPFVMHFIAGISQVLSEHMYSFLI
ncbi:MAG: LacI family DNA-binding transcriptional regulator, partial [Acetanaerobacterium sp.]